jgi:hypothetical protein
MVVTTGGKPRVYIPIFKWLKSVEDSGDQQ